MVKKLNLFGDVEEDVEEVEENHYSDDIPKEKYTQYNEAPNESFIGEEIYEDYVKEKQQRIREKEAEREQANKDFQEFAEKQEKKHNSIFLEDEDEDSPNDYDYESKVIGEYSLEDLQRLSKMPVYTGASITTPIKKFNRKKIECELDMIRECSYMRDKCLKEGHHLKHIPYSVVAKVLAKSVISNHHSKVRNRYLTSKFNNARRRGMSFSESFIETVKDPQAKVCAQKPLGYVAGLALLLCLL